MNRAIFGQYWAADSPVHDMDPRMKLTLMVAVMVIIFCAFNYAALAVCAAFLFVFYALASIPPKAAVRSIGPLFFIVVITCILNLFWVQGGDVYWQVGPLQISQAGVHSAVFLSVRLTLLLMAASLLTLTTTTLDLTDAFEGVLMPFRRFGFPAHEFAMIMGIALRFLPQFVTELHSIRAAQLSRGASFSKNPFRGGMSSLTSLMVPLFTSAFRHADTLSAAMDARCYHGADGRTRLTPMKMTRLDAFGAAACVLMLACIVVANVLG